MDVRNRNDTDVCDNDFTNHYFMAENNKNNNYMADNTIYLRMFIIGSSRDGKNKME